MRDTENQAPLAGVKVLDFGHTVMGPTAGLTLADLGADVIRIEPAPNGDPTRALKGFGTGYFPFYNRNKRSLAVNLKTKQGRKIVDQLLATADVMLENFAPGAIERLGFGYKAVAQRHPHIVFLSLKGFLPGPHENRVALDEVVQMMSGLAYMTGPPGQPLRAGASVIDVMGGVFGALGVIAALRERDQTGQGGLVRSALFESAVFLMGQHLAYAALTNAPPPPMPARVSAWAIYDQFQTKDAQMVFLGLTSDKHWKRFCEHFKRPDLAADDTLSTNNKRITARDRLKPLIAQILKGLSLKQIERRAVAAELPFAHVARPEQLFENEHLLSAKRLLRTILPGGGEAALPALPIEVRGHKTRLKANPPQIGAHTRALLLELGYRANEIERLIAEQIIAAPTQKAAP